jgi:hypothetical protein
MPDVYGQPTHRGGKGARVNDLLPVALWLALMLAASLLRTFYGPAYRPR